ncbi:putative membrane protein YozV [Clostridia bacterium]|nr:putative membrane protein YozV [Clostridia bacterium]
MWPVKSKVTAGLLAILFGILGMQWFYLGKPMRGILSVIFCWTYIPAILGVVHGIIILCESDYTFQLKNRVRVR